MSGKKAKYRMGGEHLTEQLRPRPLGGGRDILSDTCEQSCQAGAGVSIWGDME